MAAKKPIILAVDDDPQVLAAIDRDLRAEFGADYRILRVGSGPEALRNPARAAGQGGAPGPDAGRPAHARHGRRGAAHRPAQLFPEAKRVLLTAYADTEAAMRAINSARLDYYLMKPWDPPQQLLYPTLHDLLAAWQARVQAPVTTACA